MNVALIVAATYLAAGDTQSGEGSCAGAPPAPTTPLQQAGSVATSELVLRSARTTPKMWRGDVLDGARQELAITERAAKDGVFCADVVNAVKEWGWALQRSPGSHELLAAITERRDRLNALAAAAQELDGQHPGAEPLRMTPAHAIELGQDALRRYDQAIAEGRCDRVSSRANLAIHVLSGLGEHPAGDPGGAKYRQMARLCAIVHALRGADEGRVGAPVEIITEVRATLKIARARPPLDVDMDTVKKVDSARSALAMAGLLGTNDGRAVAREIDEFKSQVDRAGAARAAMDPVKRAAGCRPDDSKCDGSIIEAMRESARRATPEMKRQFPGIEAATLMPTEATAGATKELETLRCEAGVLRGAHKVEAALEKSELALGRVRTTEPADSAVRLDEEVHVADRLSADLGRHREAAKRIGAAVAAFEARQADRTGVVAIHLEEAYRTLASVETRAGNKDGAARATKSAERYQRGQSEMNASAQQFDIFGGIAAAQQLQDASTRMQSGDHDTLRRDLEKADKIDVMRLALLAQLEDEAGNKEAARAALEDGAEGTLDDLEAVQTIGGAGGGAGGGGLLVKLVETFAGYEAAALEAARRDPTDERRRLLAFWVSEQRKGRFFDALAFARSVRGEAGAERLRQLRIERGKRAARFLRERGEDPHALAAQLRACVEWQGQPDPAIERIGTLEQQLLFKSVSLPLHMIGGGVARAQYPRGSPPAFLRAIATRLRPGDRLVTFTRFAEAAPGKTPADPPGPQPAPKPAKPPVVPYYVAFVVAPGGLSTINLGDAAEIDQAVARALPEQGAARQSAENMPPLPATMRAFHELYDRIWRPLAEKVHGASHVYVAPDAALQRVPFAALHDGTHWLFEEITLSNLHSARDLLAPTWPVSERPSLVLGSPQPPPAPVTGRRFDDLEGTRTETQEVSSRLGVGARTGMDADERTLLFADRPRILHVASHAISVIAGVGSATVKPATPDKRAAAGKAKGTRGVELVDAGDEAHAPGPARLAAMPSDDTEEGWMSAALALSPPPAGQGPEAGAWDGFATAYEILTMDLRGTELVTLSACETSGGDMIKQHGVTSLERAFLNAGADSVVASLWKVDDVQTGEWMKAFYDALQAGKPRAEAMRAAMFAVAAHHRDPYYWAAFMLVGAAGPLRSGNNPAP